MAFEIGATYAVSPRRYGFTEEETWVNGDKAVKLSTVWKSGTINITPQNEQEVEWLTDGSLQGDDQDLSFHPYDFEVTEFVASFNGSTEVEDVRGFSDEEEIDGTIDEVWEGVDEQGEEYLAENGYHMEDGDVIFYGELTIERID